MLMSLAGIVFVEQADEIPPLLAPRRKQRVRVQVQQLLGQCLGHAGAARLA